jgi:hypothetical protein
MDEWVRWTQIKEKYFGYHHDLAPEEIALRLGGTVAYHQELNGQWVAAVVVSR